MAISVIFEKNPLFLFRSALNFSSGLFITFALSKQLSVFNVRGNYPRTIYTCPDS